MNEVKQPRIGIIGTGAIGGFYGVMLARAGFDVHFLLRSEFSAVTERGLRIDSLLHGELLLNPVQTYSSAQDLPPCDWLLVGAKTTSNASLAPAIIQAAAPGAKVVLLQNGLAVEEDLRPLLPSSLHLLGGLCYVGVHRDGPGLVRHLAAGDINLGYHSGPAGDDAARLAILEQGAALFQRAGIKSVAMQNLDAARWMKLIWNVPFNGLSVVLRAGTTLMLANESSRQLILDVMDEVVQGLQACGYSIPDGYIKQMMNMTDAMPDYWPSMYFDFAERRPMELDTIYARPLATALAAGCDMPKVRALYQALSFIDARGANPV